MIKECKKCGSKNLYLEPRVKGQDILTADMVALKCKDCGFWLKWCPKDERKFYLKQPKDKWQKLKEWLNGYIEYHEALKVESAKVTGIYRVGNIIDASYVLDKMQELEGEDERQI